VIATAVDTVFKACMAKADQVLSLYRQTIGSATHDIADQVMKLARGEFSKQDEILPVAAWVDSVCGSNLEHRIRHDHCGLNDGNKQYTIDQCKKWIRESWNVEFWGGSAGMGIASQFKKICDDTVEAVDTAWQTMNDYLKGYQNQFPQPTTVTQPVGLGAGPGSGPGSGPGYPPGTGSYPGGGGSSTPPYVPTPPPGGTTPGSTPGSTPGNGSVPGSTAGTPSVPSVPIPGAHSGTDPSLAVPGSGASTLPASGSVPGTGTLPSGSVPGAGGSGGGLPSVPIPGAGGSGSGSGTGSGLPGSSSIPGAGGIPGVGDPKQVTVKDGNRSITVGEPDAHGRSKVTIDEGDGKPPKSFDLNFGDGAVPGPGGTGAIPGIGTDGAELVTAGADGKAVIHDGADTITAERVPGHPEQMKLTVDDGTPPPNTYTVDFNKDVPGAAPPGSGLGTLSSHLPGGGVDLPPAHGGGGGGHVGGGGGGGFSGGATPGAGPGGGSLDAGAATGSQTPGSAAQPAAASAGAGGPGHGGQGGQAGGMPMGGMGGMGGGQGGGDQTRTSKWRTQGQLFDDVEPAAHFSGVVGEDPAKGNRPPKRGS
jgi:hypothetical protein